MAKGIVLALIFLAWPGICSAGGADLQFLKRELWLGIVRKGENAPLVFELKNVSANSIRIVSSEGSCRCTTVQSAPAEILPQTTGKFSCLFASAREAGLVNHSVTVETADGQDIVGEFQAWVEPLEAIVAAPEELVLTLPPGASAATGELSITGRRGVLEKLKMDFPESIHATTVSKPAKVEGFPELRKIVCRISARRGEENPTRREVVRLRAGAHHLDVPVDIHGPPLSQWGGTALRTYT